VVRSTGSLTGVSIEQPEGSQPPDIRASDAERDDVVQRLSGHAASGRLTLEELEQRISQAFGATTRGELARLTADLPQSAPSAPAASPERRRKPTKMIFSMMGAAGKKGRWRVGRRVTSLTIMGGNDIDLRHAELDSEDVTIVCIAIMGGMDIYVPDTIDVDVAGFALMGGNDERGSTRAPRSGAPRVKIMAYALMGGIDVWRLPEEARGLSLKQAKKLAKEVG
jgi:hypothetical protein